MATTAAFADYVLEQVRHPERVWHRKMFGEYALYVGEKIVALLADEQIFVKPTVAGRAFLGTPTEGPPYPGAKPFFNVNELLDDSERLSALIAITEAELPAAKVKKPKAKKLATKKVAAKKGPTKKPPKR